MIDRFLTLYEPSPPRWSNITSVVQDLEWTDHTAQTMSEYLDLHGIDRRFSRELVEAATRVNYAQARVFLPSGRSIINDTRLLCRMWTRSMR